MAPSICQAWDLLSYKLNLLLKRIVFFSLYYVGIDYCSFVIPLQSINKELRDLKTRMQGLLEEKDTLSHEYQDLTKKKAKVELTIKDILEEIEGDKKSRVSWLF